MTRTTARECGRTGSALVLSTLLLASCGGGGDGGGPTAVRPLDVQAPGGPEDDGSGTVLVGSPFAPADGASAPPVMSGGETPIDTGPDDGEPVGGSPDGCGAITIARMNWQSAETIAEIDRAILRDGFGCAPTLVDGDTLSTFESMRARGEPDLAPELWINAVREPLAASVAAGDLFVGAPTVVDGGLEGWWVPRYLLEANPDIRTVEGALRRPELFPGPEGGGLSAVHNCPDGWNCAITNENLFRAYGADAAGFALVDPGSAAGLDDSVARAVERGEGWLGYYWSPTALIERLDLVRLESLPHDAAEWERCTTVPDCPDPAPVGYPESEIRAVFGAGFAGKADVAVGYIERRRLTNDLANELLAWRADNDADGKATARHFLDEYESVWSSWVDPETADRVRAALR